MIPSDDVYVMYELKNNSIIYHIYKNYDKIDMLEFYFDNNNRLQSSYGEHCGEIGKITFDQQDTTLYVTIYKIETGCPSWIDLEFNLSKDTSEHIKFLTEVRFVFEG
jgi:hypothetical protein